MKKLTPKQEAIKKAYGEHWERLEKDVDGNGWLYTGTINEPVFEPSIGKIQEHEDDFCFRPVSLKGIENNNGWIKIESIEDMKEDLVSCFCVYRDSGIIELFENISGMNNYTFVQLFSHYQHINKPKMPIY